MYAKLGNERCFLLKRYDDDLEIIQKEQKTDFEKEMIDVLISLLSFKFSTRDVAIWYSYYKTETNIDVLCKEFGLGYEAVRDIFDKINSFLTEMEKADSQYSSSFDKKIKIRIKDLDDDEKKALSILFMKFLKLTLGDSYPIWKDRVIKQMTCVKVKKKYGCSLNKIFKSVHFVDTILKHRYKKFDEIFKQVIVFKR